MATEPTSRAASDGDPHRRRTAMRVAGFVIGLLLLIAAVAVVVSQRSAVGQALHSIGDHPPGRLALLVATMLSSIAVNVLLTSAMIRLLLSRYPGGERIGLGEMSALIAAATLVNYLPLRPGVFGRMAYHKVVHGISLRDGVAALVHAAAITAVSALILSGIALATRSQSLSTLLLAPIPAVIMLAAGFVLRGHRALLWAAAARLVDVLVTAARYHAAFALIGSPIDAAASIAFACIGALATMVPFVSNGLGLREWAIGLLAPVIAAHHMPLGLTADLMNRAAELFMITVVGIPASVWLARRFGMLRAQDINRGPVP